MTEKVEDYNNPGAKKFHKIGNVWASEKKRVVERREIMKVMLNRVAMMLSMAILCLSLIFQTAHAEIYKWVDEKGTVHFTEDPAAIPEKYQEKVKTRTTEDDLMTPEERVRARKRYEEEVRERLKREKKEYDAKELEKRVKEIVDQAQRQNDDLQRERQREREKGASTLENDLRSQGLTACQREMLTHSATLGSEKLRNDAKNPSLTCSQREALVNAERLRRGLEPIKFTQPASYIRTGGGAINTETGDFCPKVKGGYLDPKRGFIPAND